MSRARRRPRSDGLDRARAAVADLWPAPNQVTAGGPLGGRGPRLRRPAACAPADPTRPGLAGAGRVADPVGSVTGGWRTRARRTPTPGRRRSGWRAPAGPGAGPRGGRGGRVHRDPPVRAVGAARAARHPPWATAGQPEAGPAGPDAGGSDTRLCQDRRQRPDPPAGGGRGTGPGGRRGRWGGRAGSPRSVTTAAGATSRCCSSVRSRAGRPPP